MKSTTRSNYSLPEYLIQSPTMAVAVVDFMGNYTYVNPTFIQRYQLTQESVIGKPFEHTIHPDDYEHCNVAIQQLVEAQKPCVQVLVRKPGKLNGGYIQTVWDFSLIKNEEGAPEAVLCIGQDVTEKNEAINEAAKTQLMLKAIYHSSMYGKLYIGNDLQIEYFNDFANKMIKKVCGIQLVLGDSISPVLTYMAGIDRIQYTFNKIEENVDYKFEHFDGKLWWQVMMYPVFDERHLKQGFAMNIHDVTLEKDNFQKMEMMVGQLKRIAWRQSHEVRKPIANILGVMELMRREHSEWFTHEYIQILKNATEQLDEVVQKIVHDTH